MEPYLFDIHMSLLCSRAIASEDKKTNKMNPASDVNCAYAFRTYGTYLRSHASLNWGTLWNLVFVWRDGNEESLLSMIRSEGARFLSKQFEYREGPGTKFIPTYRTTPKIGKEHIFIVFMVWVSLVQISSGCNLGGAWCPSHHFMLSSAHRVGMKIVRVTVSAVGIRN